MKDVVFSILEQMLRNSPEASYKRLNPALRDALGNCIAADLPFLPDTFRRIYNELRGGWWFGDGSGSAMGEHYYTTACACNHASAIKSFEAFAERPGVLWEENSQTPERLHAGSQFSWKGYYVTVTSMRSDSLVACTYKDTPYRGNRGLKVGVEIGDYNSPHIITSSKRDGKATILRVVKAERPDEGSRVVAKRFTITYAEIVEFRRTESARVKKVIAEIEKCNPEKDGSRLTKLIAAEHFRHFQLELINAAFSKRKNWSENESRIETWRTGINGAWLDVKETYLRVRGDLVECSNGNSVSLAAVKRVLPVVLDRRKNHGPLSLPIDGYHINRLDAKGVKIGCTVVPWSEVDYIAARL